MNSRGKGGDQPAGVPGHQLDCGQTRRYERSDSWWSHTTPVERRRSPSHDRYHQHVLREPRRPPVMYAQLYQTRSWSRRLASSGGYKQPKLHTRTIPLSRYTGQEVECHASTSALTVSPEF